MAIPDGWVKFKDLASSLEASALGALLEQNGVPVHLEHFGELPGLEVGVVVAVPRGLLHRAQWLLAGQNFTDEELSSLATGELPDGHQE